MLGWRLPNYIEMHKYASDLSNNTTDSYVPISYINMNEEEPIELIYDSYFNINKNNYGNISKNPAKNNATFLYACKNKSEIIIPDDSEIKNITFYNYHNTDVSVNSIQILTDKELYIYEINECKMIDMNDASFNILNVEYFEEIIGNKKYFIQAKISKTDTGVAITNKNEVYLWGVYKGQKNTLNKLENNIISNNIISFDIHDYKCLFINTSKQVYLYDISSSTNSPTPCKDSDGNTIEKATNVLINKNKMYIFVEPESNNNVEYYYRENSSDTQVITFNKNIFQIYENTHPIKVIEGIEYTGYLDKLHNLFISANMRKTFSDCLKSFTLRNFLD